MIVYKSEVLNIIAQDFIVLGEFFGAFPFRGLRSPVFDASGKIPEAIKVQSPDD